MFDDSELRQELEDVARQFKVFECVECAEAIKQYCIARNINGKHIKLFTGSSEDPFGNIYTTSLSKPFRSMENMRRLL